MTGTCAECSALRERLANVEAGREIEQAALRRLLQQATAPVDLCGADVREAEEAWDDLSMYEANLWASKHAFMAIWLNTNVLAQGGAE